MSKIIQVGNLVPPRRGFENPQEGRVYSPLGLCPTFVRHSGGRVHILLEYSKENKPIENKNKSMSIRYKVISWSRDDKGHIIKYNFNDLCNTVTTFIGADFTASPRLLIEYD